MTRAKRYGLDILHHTVALLVALTFVAPLVWVVGISLRTPGLPPPTAWEWWPTEPAWSNYRRIFELVPLANHMFNSLRLMAVVVPITIITASWAGFALARLPRRPRSILVALSVVLLMIPDVSLWLTRYLLYDWLNLIDSLWALALPAYAGWSPLFVLLFYWNFRRIPGELFDAAQLDGASILDCWAKVALPLARPTAVTVAVLAFSRSWNDFVGPLLYLKSELLYTLPVGVQILQQMDRTQWPLLMAAALLMTMPVVLLFLLIQHHIWSYTSEK